MGQIGELLIRGPCITRSYYKQQKQEESDWLRTGDIVCISEREEMQIVDRSKDLIKSGGEWISSSDMENYILLLGEQSNIASCAVIGVPHPRWDERPILIVQRKDNSMTKVPAKDVILRHLAKQYAKFQMVDDILFWECIPMTGTGKKSKKMIRERLKKEKYILPQLRSKL